MRLPILIALSCVLQVPAADEPPTARDRMATLFKKEFKFDASLTRKPDETLPIPEEGDVVVLPLVAVHEPFRGADKAIEEATLRAELGHFTWKHGGTIHTFERLPLQPRIGFKYNPEHNGIDILNFSW